jgi:hypothetical protein
LIALLEPGGEALQVGEVLSGGALTDLRVLRQKGQEDHQRIIRRKIGLAELQSLVRKWRASDGST